MCKDKCLVCGGNIVGWTVDYDGTREHVCVRCWRWYKRIVTSTLIR